LIKSLEIKSMVMVLALMFACATTAGAAAAGRLSLVQGQVDLLKNGKLPAVAVKVGDAVGPGDVIRTKSRSRAQITFIDNSTLTISPKSRIAVKEFVYDAAQRKRSAVLELFRGFALAVVNKITKVKEPDFVIKTHTAIVGVRGTEIGFRLSANSSTVLNFKGYTQVGNISPQVSQRFLKAFKVAYSFGWNQDHRRWVYLRDMQGTRVGLHRVPTPPFTITPAEQRQFMQQLTSEVSSESNVPRDLPESMARSSVPDSITPPGPQTAMNILSTVTVPPTLVPQTKTPPPVTTHNESHSYTE
jgi:hypothetical protein